MVVHRCGSRVLVPVERRVVAGDCRERSVTPSGFVHAPVLLGNRAPSLAELACAQCGLLDVEAMRQEYPPSRPSTRNFGPRVSGGRALVGWSEHRCDASTR